MTDLTYLPIDLNSGPEAPKYYPMYRGDAEGRNDVVVTWLDTDDAPVDLTLFGDTWACMAKGSGLTITLDVDDSQAAIGVLTIAIKDVDSPTLTNVMDFDIQVTGGTVSPLTVFKGKFAATGQVTT